MQEFGPVAGLLVKAFGGATPARWLVRAPGRINLIGEHTDYNGFPVMPMAIGRAIRMAVAPRDDGRVCLVNCAPELYPDRSFLVSEDLPPFEPGDWGNYAKAAVQSLARLAVWTGREAQALRGMSCAVDGDIPPAAGLSSSTALVVATGLAFAAVNELGLSGRALAERLAEAEHYVGTQGGGMDQAVCLLGRRDHALKIDFYPLAARPIPFAPTHGILAAHSTLSARKTGQQRLAYNRRVVECRVGAHLLARRLGAEPTPRLADLGRARPDEDLTGILHEVTGGERALSLTGCSQLCGVSTDEFTDRFLRLGAGGSLPMPADGLKVLPRCRHVFTEAGRVERAAECLAAGDMAALGCLMDESHQSCAEDYEISCPELDELVGLMRGAGALGARLTGAGFGGFAIGLVRREDADEVRAALSERFYEPRGEAGDESAFLFRPAPGAFVQKVD
jgi:galactokinase